MSAIVLDTHCLIWYLAGDSKLTMAGRSAVDSAIQAGDPIYVSSITLVEMIYLGERGRIVPAAIAQVRQAFADSSSGIKLVSLDLKIADALGRVSRNEIPDMPDRIIAATALYLGHPLVTADGRIRKSAIATIW